MSEMDKSDRQARVMRDLAGEKIGRWTVLERAKDHIQPNGSRVAMWKCRCDCGTERDVSHAGLTNGRTHSCGCLTK